MKKVLFFLIQLLCVQLLFSANLEVVAPNGNEKFIVGGKTELSWKNPNGLAPLSLYYSVDEGKNWHLISDFVTGESYTWNPIPNHISNKCLFKVEYNSESNSTTVWPSKHSKRMCAVTFDDDASHVASGSDDSNIFIFDVATEKKTHTLSNHSKVVEFLSWSPDGTMLASASRDLSVKIWDAKKWTEKTSYTKHSQNVYQVDWNSTSDKVVSAGLDRSFVVFDVSTNKVIKQVKTQHTSAISSVKWSNDNSKIVCGSWDGSFSVWDAKTFNKIKTIDYSGDDLRDVDFSYDDKYIACICISGNVYVYDNVNDKNYATLKKHSSGGSSIEWDDDTYSLASAAADNKVYVWDVEKKTCEQEFDVQNESVIEIDWDPISNCIVAVGTSKNINILCNSTGISESDSSDAVWEIYECPELQTVGNIDEFFETGEHQITIPLRNPSESDVMVDDIYFKSMNKYYEIVAPSLPFLLKGKTTENIIVKFKPDTMGVYSSDIVIKTECDSLVTDTYNNVFCPPIEVLDSFTEIQGQATHIVKTQINNPNDIDVKIRDIAILNIKDFHYYKVIAPSFPTVVKANSSLELELELIANEYKEYEIDVVVSTDCDQDTCLIKNNIFCPQLIVQHNNDNLPKVDSQFVLIPMINDTEADIEVESLDFIKNDDNKYKLISPMPPFVVNAHSKVEVKLQLLSGEYGVYSAELKYKTECDSSSLRALNPVVCMQLDDRDIIKGINTIDDHTIEVPIINTNKFDVLLENIEILGENADKYKLISPDLPFIVAGHSTRNLMVELAAEKDTVYKVAFRLMTDCDTSTISMENRIECPELDIQDSIYKITRKKKVTHKIDITNLGLNNANIREIKILGDGNKYYAISKPQVPLLLHSGRSVELEVNLFAKDFDEYYTRICIVTDCDTHYVSIRTDVVCPEPTLTGTLKNFKEPGVYTIEIPMTNNEGIDAIINKLELLGVDSKYYTVIEPEEIPFIIRVGETKNLILKLKAEDFRLYEVQLKLTSNCSEHYYDIKNRINCPELEIISNDLMFNAKGKHKVKLDVHNPTNGKGTITDIIVKDEDYACYTLLKPTQFPIEIAGGEKISVELALDAADYKEYKCNIKVVTDCNEADGKISNIVDCPELIISGLDSAYDDLTKYNYKIQVKNIGITTGVIEKITFSDKLSGTFKHLNPALPVNIASGNTQEIEVEFTPKKKTDYAGDIKLHTQCAEYTSEINQKAILIDIDSIDFSAAHLCEVQENILKISNNYFEPYTIFLENSWFEGNAELFKFDCTDKTIDVPVDDTVSIPINFKGTEEGIYHTKLHLLTSYREIVVHYTANVAGIVVPESKQTKNINFLEKNTLVVEAEIPVNKDNILTEIRMNISPSTNAVYLYPESFKAIENSLTWENKGYNGNGELEIIGQGNLELPFSGKLFTMEYEAMLDSEREANIVMTIVYDCTEKPFVLEMLKIQQICHEGLRNVVGSATPTKIKEIFPNPANSSVKLEYSVAFDDSEVFVELVNTAGEVSRKFDFGKMKAGDYKTEISIYGIANGSYFLRYNCAGEQFVQKIMINQ
jgi:WD40 repeat protein